MPIDESEVEALADQILEASDSASSIPPITDARPDFGLADAYRVSEAITARRIARGERPIGWKIGFTNETIWDEYGVHAPIWGPMYDRTVGTADPATNASSVVLAGLVEPRIEPEIAFRISKIPSPDMDERALLGCIDAVAHGFEIVQSVFPRWHFRAADTVAAFALHGRYRHGPLVAIGPEARGRWQDMLSRFAITLFCDGSEIDRGVATNVLGGGPLTALRHLVRGFTEYSAGYRFRVGDIVTTGTVTRAFPVASGERWRTKLDGIPLEGMELALV